MVAVSPLAAITSSNTPPIGPSKGLFMVLGLGNDKHQPSTNAFAETIAVKMLRAAVFASPG